MAGHRIDDLADPRLPLPLRAWNSLGGPLAERVGRLDLDDLLETASRRTGCDDFGDPGFHEPLRVLLAAVESEADLSPLGRVNSRQLFVQLLSNRLLIEDLIKQNPEILDEPVERPIVIAGLPRTGTTHLHNLMSQDPALRFLPYWESMEPAPHPKDAGRGGGDDPRITRCEKALKLVDWAMPLFPRMHRMTAEGPHEEIQLLACAFSTMLFESSYHVPSYQEWYTGTDQTPAYRYLRRVLQALQWQRGRGRRWILKSPQHLEQLGPLMSVFPDANVVQTHRDPLRITASLCTMIAYGNRMQSRTVDPVKVGRYWADRVVDLLRGSIEGRAHVPGEVFDVRFHEYMKDQLGTVERAFAFAGQPMSGEAAGAIRAFQDANPRGEHGTIAYHLEDVGLDADERRRALRFYQEHFDVPDE